MGFDPASLAVIGMVAGAAGSATSAYGSYQTGQAGARAASYQAQVAANNAVIARQNAVQDIQAGEIAATNKGLQTRAKVGSEKAIQGASGVDVNSGSAAAVRAGTAEIGMLDALTIRSNAAKQAYSQQVAAGSYDAQSELDKMKGAQAERAGTIGATGTLLSGAATVGGSFSRYQQKFGNNGIGGGDNFPSFPEDI